MNIQGLVFAGTATVARPQMAAFMRNVLGLAPAQVPGVEADLFDLPDGSSFAVASPQGMGTTDRSLGFLVVDIEEAVRELRARRRRNFRQRTGALRALPGTGRSPLRAGRAATRCTSPGASGMTTSVRTTLGSRSVR